MKRKYEVVFSRSYEVDIEDYVPQKDVINEDFIEKSVDFAKMQFDEELYWLSSLQDDFSAKVYLIEDNKRILIYPKNGT